MSEELLKELLKEVKGLKEEVSELKKERPTEEDNEQKVLKWQQEFKEKSVRTAVESEVKGLDILLDSMENVYVSPLRTNPKFNPTTKEECLDKIAKQFNADYTRLEKKFKDNKNATALLKKYKKYAKKTPPTLELLQKRVKPDKFGKEEPPKI